MANYFYYKVEMTLKNGDNNVIKTFDHPDLKMLKDDIKYIYSLNKNEYPECSVKIMKYFCSKDCSIRIEDNDYYIKSNRLYKMKQSAIYAG